MINNAKILPYPTKQDRLQTFAVTTHLYDDPLAPVPVLVVLLRLGQFQHFIQDLPLHGIHRVGRHVNPRVGVQ